MAEARDDTGLGSVEISVVTEEASGGGDTDRHRAVVGKLAALGDLATSIGSELRTLVDERAAVEELASAVGSKLTFHSRELSSYLREFNKAMFHLLGAKELGDLEETYLQMARTLAFMAEAREPYARGHAERVSMLANDIAVWLGCSVEQTKEIQAAAILHDVGKIAIPENILYKPGELTLAEYGEVKRHPVVAVEIVSTLNRFENCVPIVEGHHEWYDGCGYPNRLKADEIHLGARILAVADAYDAMTSPRPYRPALGSEEAVEVIKRGAGTQWDPMIVYAFVEMVGPRLKVAGPAAASRGEGKQDAPAPAACADSSKKEDVVSRAQEALKRAEHWANWMETIEQQDRPGRR